MKPPAGLILVLMLQKRRLPFDIFPVLHLLETPLSLFSVFQSTVDLFLFLCVLPCYYGKFKTSFKLEECSKSLCIHHSLEHHELMAGLVSSGLPPTSLNPSRYHVISSINISIHTWKRQAFCSNQHHSSNQPPLMSNLYSVFTCPHCFLMVFICNVTQTW